MCSASYDPSTHPSLLADLKNSNTNVRTQAQSDFFVRYRSMLIGWAETKLLPSSVSPEDVASLMITELLFQTLPNFQYDKSQRFRGYLWRTLHNIHCDLLKKHAKERATDLETCLFRILDDPHAKWELFDEMQENQRLARHIIYETICLVRHGRGDQRAWKAWYYRKVKGLKLREVAARLDLPNQKVSKQILRVEKLFIKVRAKNCVQDFAGNQSS